MLKFKPSLRITFLLIIPVLTFLVGFSLTYFGLKLAKIVAKKEADEKTNTVFTPPPLSDDPQAPINILLLGYGGAGHEGGYLSDALMVAHIDPQKDKIVLISVPRDLWAPIPVDWDNQTNYKINHAHAIGGDETTYPNKKPEFRGEKGRGELTKYVVGLITGLPIKYYISVDFSGFTEAVDLLGGIEVEVAKTFDDYFYPVKGKENETCGFSAEEIAEFHAKYSGFELEKQFTCRYEHIHFDVGRNTISGESALKFVRSRHSDVFGGDFARNERQQAVLNGIKDKIISLGILTKIDPLLDKLTESIKTDINLDVLKENLSTLREMADYQISTINLSPENVLANSTGPGGQYILIPKAGINQWQSLRQFISEKISQ